MPPIDEAELQRFFNENLDQYRVEPAITFTHVFISDAKKGSAPNHAKILAQQTLEQLNAQQVPFVDAGKYGDRFLYNLNYVERTPAYVANHFGKDFAANLFQYQVTSEWQGPVASEYGYHLVLIKEKAAARVPTLTEVAPIVLADALRAQQRKARVSAVNELVQKYTVANKFDVLVEAQ